MNIDGLLEAKEYDAALEQLTAALKENPDDDALLLLRSVVYTRLQKFELALADAEKAKTSPEAQLRRAINLWRLARKSEAKNLVPHFDKSPEADIWRNIIGLPPKVDWYQSSDTVHVVVYEKNVPSDAKIEILPNKISIEDWSQTLNPIVPGESTYEVTPYKVEFVLKKAQAGSWSTLFEQRKLADTLQYNKWDNLDASSDEEDKDPMDFFQKLYANSDDATKRAMMKSYIESNGTALSTDWAEVSKKKVETVPPENMEAKEF